METEAIIYIAFYIVAFVGLIWLLCIPGIIATKKNHPHATVIGIIGVVGGIFFLIGWVIALIWACVLPSASNEMIRKVKANPDVADEISKLKNLEDKGILTADEFQFKKTQLLGPITS